MLRSVRRLARSGDTERAWQLFDSSGLIGETSDADVLSLKGRLTKDRALKASGADRSTLLGNASDAYLQAATLRPSTYPLINAATLALLDGRRDRAQDLARRILVMLDSGEHEPETAYYLGATRAEAELLLGQSEAAQATLANAIRQAPAAWEDHASTLRHFRLILENMGEPNGWLDRHRPPPSLHFGGIIHIDPANGDPERAITEAVRAIAPGFAFGALAAGSDIIAAEAAVAAGAELHIVLPSSINAFRRASVHPFGAQWNARFDALLDAVESIDTIDHLDTVSEEGILLAEEMAMGLAIRQGRILETGVVALRAGQSQAGGDNGRPLDEAWARRGLPIETVAIHRTPLSSPPLPRFAREALLAVAVAPGTERLRIANIPIIGTRAGYAIARFGSIIEAAEAALALRAKDHDLPIAMDYSASDPDEHHNDHWGTVIAAAQATPPGTILTTRAGALALELHAPALPYESYGEIATSIGDLSFFLLIPANRGS